jgi:hypothetical protein
MEWLAILMGVTSILARRPYARMINSYNKRVWKMDLGERLTAQTVVLVGAAMILFGAWHLIR